MAETDAKETAGRNRHVDRIISRIFDIIADAFPVAAASDEFWYFPQVTNDRLRWDRWDRFDREGVRDAVGRLQGETAALKRLHGDDRTVDALDAETLIDVSVVLECVETLVEQLTLVRSWETQPTWHLTIACVGLAEALSSGQPEAARRRAAGLAEYIDRAALALRRVPSLFRDLGIEMVAGTRRFFAGLQEMLPALTSAQQALSRFESVLTGLPGTDRFRLPRDLFEQTLTVHLQLRLDCRQLDNLLEQEIREMRRRLEGIAGAPLTAAGLQAAIHRMPPPPIDEKGLLALYRQEVTALADHCVRKGLVAQELVRQCPVRVEPVPSYLAPIRAASSYSIPARHPPTGGIFYVINAEMPAESQKSYQREYRLLVAHETYPGHHLLDVHRWSLPRSSRRVVERPLFYEGWACFAEALVVLTGYLHARQDRLLLARRRLWRAIRGQVELGLQMGQLDLPAAARRLTEAGMNPQDAMAAVRKYPLNPGYQSCYTAGVRRFLDLYDRYGHHNPSAFSAAVLQQGEIGFEQLEKVLARRPADRPGKGPV